MRVLYVTQEFPDYLPDAVYHGLVQVLGAPRVRDWPRIQHYHRPAPPGARAPMFWYDVPPGQPDATLDEALDECDAIVIGTLWPEAYPHALEVLRRAPEVPIAYLDGEDDPYVREIRRHVDVYCKREILVPPLPFVTPFPLQKVYFRFGARHLTGPLREAIDVASTARDDLVPLNFGIPEVGWEPPAGEPAYDVTFMGSPTSRVRAKLVRELRALEREGLRVFVPDAPLGWREYLETLARSRVCVSLRGAGWDTLRYWEIPYARSMLLSERLRIVVPDNFVDGEEAVFAAPEDLPRVARDLIRRGDPEAIARRGARALRARHMSVNRARTLLDALRKADPAPRLRTAAKARARWPRRFRS